MANFEINGEKVKVDVPSDTPLLWTIREELGKKGTKFGCGKGVCGSCTVHFNGSPIRSCIMPVGSVEGQKVETIENQGKETLHPVQLAWIKHNVPQCGYCQSGQVMLAIGLLESRSSWDLEELYEQMNANLCRCGTYNKIKAAVAEAAKEMGKIS